MKKDIKSKENFNSTGEDKYKKYKNIILIFLIMSVCTGVSTLSYQVQMFESNIVMIYLLGIVFVSYLFEGYIYCLFSSIASILLYNYFFTEPFYTLKVNNSNYLITFVVMFIVGFVTSMLTVRIKLERQRVEEREKYFVSLYLLEKKLLNVININDLGKTSVDEIARQFNANILLQFYSLSDCLLYKCVDGKDIFENDLDTSARMEAYSSGCPCGCGTTLFPNASAYYSPIFSQKGVIGVLGISLKNGNILSSEQKTFIDVVIPQISVVLQREKNYEKQQKAKLEMEKERMRADMLRSISHDFRTPLAGVMGLASTALDNYEKMSDEVKKNFLQSIYADAVWLHEIVENILQTTRFEEGRIKLNIEEEAAEEIITEAVTHVRKQKIKHKIHVKIPDDIIIIKVDGVLLRQVLVNVLNNSINYSPNETDIIILLYQNENKVYFEIKDSGPGIPLNEIPYIFDRYYRSKSNIKVNRKGMGLGLALCKSIVKAHGGEITIENNIPHGAIVKICMPIEKGVEE